MIGALFSYLRRIVFGFHPFEKQYLRGFRDGWYEGYEDAQANERSFYDYILGEDGREVAGR
jgi:hypothetical protein